MYCGQEAKGCQEGGWSKEGREEEEERKEEEPLALSLAPPDADLTAAAWSTSRQDPLARYDEKEPLRSLDRGGSSC